MAAVGVVAGAGSSREAPVTQAAASPASAITAPETSQVPAWCGLLAGLVTAGARRTCSPARARWVRGWPRGGRPLGAARRGKGDRARRPPPEWAAVGPERLVGRSAQAASLVEMLRRQ